MPNEGLIILKQLPVIEEHLATLAGEIDHRVEAALSMVVTEETYKDVKKVRADLNKEFQELETRRKGVKAAVMEPYEHFSKVYEAYVSSKYREADTALKTRICAIESGLKQQKEDKLRAYYGEAAEALNILHVPFERVGLNITLSASEKSLRDGVDSFLHTLADGLEMIQNRADRDEVLVEFWKSLNAAQAVNIVEERHRRMEEEKARADMRAEEERAARERAAAVEERMAACRPVTAPVSADTAGDEEILRVTFTVRGPRRKLRELKKFLNDGGYQYE